MYQFHGWIDLQCRENDQELPSGREARQMALLEKVKEKIDDVEYENAHYEIKPANGHWFVSITGASNHADDTPVKFYRWIASLNSDSYGVLQTLDFEKDDHKYYLLVKDQLYRHENHFIKDQIHAIDDRDAD
jgi:hypothetical protein